MTDRVFMTNDKPQVKTKKYPVLWLFGFFTMTVLGTIGFSSFLPSHSFEVFDKTITLPIPLMIAIMLAGMSSAFMFIAAQASTIPTMLVYGFLGILAIIASASGNGMSIYQMSKSAGGDLYKSNQAIAVASSFDASLAESKSDLAKLEKDYRDLVKEHTNMDNDGIWDNDHLIAGVKAEAQAAKELFESKKSEHAALMTDARSAKSTESMMAKSENIFLQIIRERSGGSEAKETDIALSISTVAAIISLIPETGIALLALGMGVDARRKRKTKKDKTDNSKEERFVPEDFNQIPPVFHRLNKVENDQEEEIEIKKTIKDKPEAESKNDSKEKEVDQDIIKRIIEPTGIERDRKDVRALNRLRKLDRYYKSTEISSMNRHQLAKLMSIAVERDKVKEKRKEIAEAGKELTLLPA